MTRKLIIFWVGMCFFTKDHHNRILTKAILKLTIISKYLFVLMCIHDIAQEIFKTYPLTSK